MGCKVQVHEKTDKRGTWAFHSADGWYLSTSPEHYRVHNCHIKAIKKERLTDTVQFCHKHITNPSISPLDKVMHTIATCKAAIDGTDATQSNQQLRDLKKTIVRKIENNVVQHAVQPPSPTESPTTTPPVPRVANDTSTTTRSIRLPVNTRQNYVAGAITLLISQRPSISLPNHQLSAPGPESKQPNSHHAHHVPMPLAYGNPRCPAFRKPGVNPMQSRKSSIRNDSFVLSSKWNNK